MAPQRRTDDNPTLVGPGRFFLGCNYWASHAGTRMWTDWDAAVVRKDLMQMAGQGLQVLRVFPIWPDFQPIVQIYGGAGRKRDIRIGEEPLGHDEIGRAGMSPDALAHFKFLADEAYKNGQRLIVGLITGWMSGRLYVPPALEGLNVVTDPLCLKWQARFIRVFVKMFKSHPAVLGWDLGNECNCMAPTENADQAYAWTSHVVGCIRSVDTGRPIVSGMHNLTPDKKTRWTIQHQGELTDVMTTHPYPTFTPYMANDPVNTIRNGSHATAENMMYADLGGKPCFAEEMGTLGPMIASEKVGSEYMRSSLFSQWAHGGKGMLWWCAYDQDRLYHAPYDHGPAERELGLFGSDRRVKPLAKMVKTFSGILKKLPVKELPPRKTQAVCILPTTENAWGQALGAFVLGKQAQLDFTYTSTDQVLPDSKLYLVPAMSGNGTITHRFWDALLAKVAAGATLYISDDNLYVTHFKRIFKMETQTRQMRTGTAQVVLDGIPGAPSYTVRTKWGRTYKPVGCTVLGTEPDGNPAFIKTAYGKGTVYYLSVPIELETGTQIAAAHGPAAQPFWKIYRHIAAPFIRNRIASVLHPAMGITEHVLDKKHELLVMVNYGPERVKTPLTLKKGWSVTTAWYGTKPVDGSLTVPGNDAVLAVVKKK